MQRKKFEILIPEIKTVDTNAKTAEESKVAPAADGGKGKEEVKEGEAKGTTSSPSKAAQGDATLKNGAPPVKSAADSKSVKPEEPGIDSGFLYKPIF